MSKCKFSKETKTEVRNKLEEMRCRVGTILEIMDEGEGCLLCEITSIVDLAYELEKLLSFYHFQSSLLSEVEGLHDIIRALAALSHKKHGALVAIERKDSLEPYITACHTTGAAIGAQVSAPLLQTIFYPGNPLHDGAVIIQKNLIAAAGCVLPLSDRKYTNEGKKIGTRHRAAIGLSERTDALVIVVSEETGQVSFAQGGLLKPFELKLCSNAEEE